MLQSTIPIAAGKYGFLSELVTAQLAYSPYYLFPPVRRLCRSNPQKVADEHGDLGLL